MNYASGSGFSWDGPREEYASAHSPAPPLGGADGEATAEQADARSIDHILLNLMQEARSLGIPLCGEFIAAARQAIAERLARDAAAADD